jgi:hypothetical protein
LTIKKKGLDLICKISKGKLNRKTKSIEKIISNEKIAVKKIETRFNKLFKIKKS